MNGCSATPNPGSPGEGWEYLKYLAKIKKIDEEIESMQKERKALIDKWIEAEHPLKTGDNVRINEYSHTGKRMIVSSRGVEFGYFGPAWKAFGNVLKKNGEPGANSGKWSQKIE